MATPARPKAAALAAGPLDAALTRLLERRAAEAHARGLAEGRRAAHEEIGQSLETALGRLDASRDEALESGSSQPAATEPEGGAPRPIEVDGSRDSAHR